MAELDRLIQNNRAWAAAQHAADREYFSRLALKQTPKFLWIGCSDNHQHRAQRGGQQPNLNRNDSASRLDKAWAEASPQTGGGNMTTRITTILSRAASVRRLISTELRKSRANDLRLLRLQRLLLLFERRLHLACRSTGLLPDERRVIPVKAGITGGPPQGWASHVRPY